MSTLTELNKKKGRKKRNLSFWYERFAAILALINLIFVLFDLGYIPLRSFLYRYGLREIEVPGTATEITVLGDLTDWYDDFKGIEPNLDTERYLNTVDELRSQVSETGLQSAASREILEDLREQSEDIIATNPFEAVDKSATLETIKSRVREEVFGPESNLSATEAFNEFWSNDYLSGNYEEQIEFYEQNVAPLLRTNYSREIDDVSGEFVDRFWVIDQWFVYFFLADFLIRTWLIHRRHAGLNWLEAMTWRWYDILWPVSFLLAPFARWLLLLRIIPVTIRCNQADIVFLEAIQRQISQGFVASIAEDITEVVVVRVINQVQGSLKRGELLKSLSQSNTRAYIDLNNVNETAELTKLLIELGVYQVLPQVRPDIEALLRHNLDKPIRESAAFQSIRNLPGVDNAETQIVERLVSQLYDLIYGAIVASLQEDPVADKIMDRLGTNLSNAFSSEIQAKQTIEQIQSLLTDLLEEVKVNYVERLSEEDVEELLEQTRRLRQAAKSQPLASPRLRSGQNL